MGAMLESGSHVKEYYLLFEMLQFLASENQPGNE
jgi:hypothetical protein